MNAGIIEIDLHGKNVLQAKAEVDAVLKRTDSSVYRLADNSRVSRRHGHTEYASGGIWLRQRTENYPGAGRK